MKRTLLLLAFAATLSFSSGCGTLAGVAVDAATDGDGSAIAAGASVDLAIAGAIIDGGHHEEEEEHSTTVVVHERRCR